MQIGIFSLKHPLNKCRWFLNDKTCDFIVPPTPLLSETLSKLFYRPPSLYVNNSVVSERNRTKIVHSVEQTYAHSISKFRVKTQILRG